jgi:hypothetical protein
VTDDSDLSELLGRIERLQDEQRATVELLRARVAGHEQTP